MSYSNIKHNRDKMVIKWVPMLDISNVKWVPVSDNKCYMGLNTVMQYSHDACLLILGLLCVLWRFVNFVQLLGFFHLCNQTKETNSDFDVCLFRLACLTSSFSCNWI